MPFDYAGRVSRLKEALGEASVDLTVIGVGPDLRYLTGYEGSPSERLTALVVRPDADPVLFVPSLEAPLVGSVGLEMRAWGETEDPVQLATSLASSPRRVAVGDHLWSAFLLEFWREWNGADWVPASQVTRQLRIRKEPLEIDMLRRAGRGIDRVMEQIPSGIRFAGRTESNVSRDLAGLTVGEGHDSAEFTIVASGPNSASPHHHPGDRIMREGDLVVCDFGGRREGYFSDSTRTFVVGGPSDEQSEVHSVVLASNHAGRAAVRPGLPCEEVDRLARQVIVESGYGEYFIHRTGHGIGLEVHEHPYLVEGYTEPLDVGMCFSIEPGIYLPDRFGVRIEDIVVCRDDGSESLNDSDRSLVSVE